MYQPRIHLLQYHHFSSSIPSFIDGLALLKVWANQRGYCASPEKWGVWGFESRSNLWVSLIGLVVFGEVEPKKTDAKTTITATGRGLSSYQLVRAVLSVLGVPTSCFFE
jgi:U3 small nucleolar RNA-associated protein 22